MKNKSKERAIVTPFSGRVICGCCGKSFWKKSWNQRKEEKLVMYGNAVKSI